MDYYVYLFIFFFNVFLICIEEITPNLQEGFAPRFYS